MFERILVPLDGSANAERAIPWAKLYAKRARAVVYLLRVVDPHARVDGLVGPLIREARDYLQRIERELNYAGVPVTIIVKSGPAAETIAQTASLRRCDLIVMTSRGGSKVKRWLIGGTAEKLLRLSTVPVLVTQAGTPMLKQGRVQRIVVPLDGSALAEGILPWAKDLAKFHRAPIVFLHVSPLGDGVLHPGHRAVLKALRERTERYIQHLAKLGVKASFRKREGDAAFEILLEAEARAAVIATTTHGFGGFKRWLFGSVASKIVQQAGVPVLVYRASAPGRQLSSQIVAKQIETARGQLEPAAKARGLRKVTEMPQGPYKGMFDYRK